MNRHLSLTHHVDDPLLRMRDLPNGIPETDKEISKNFLPSTFHYVSLVLTENNFDPGEL